MSKDVLVITCPKCGVEVFNIEYRGRDIYWTGTISGTYKYLPEHYLCKCQRCKYEFRAWLNGEEAPMDKLIEAASGGGGKL